MCLAIPARIIEIEGSQAKAAIAGNTRTVDLSLIETAEVGDWVLVHAGFAIERLRPEDAEETLRMLGEMLPRPERPPDA